MALNNASADAAATAFVNTLASALSLTNAQKASALANYKMLFEQLYTSLKADVEIIIPAGSITSAVTGATAVGPAAPVPIFPQ